MSQPVQLSTALANNHSSECLHLDGTKHNKSNIEAKRRARRLSINNRELLLAISENNFERVEELVNGEIDIHFKDRDGHTPLHWAIEIQNCDIIKLLLKKEQDLMCKRDKSLIDYANSVNSPDILQLLQNFPDRKLQFEGEKVDEEQFESKKINQIACESDNKVGRKDTNQVKSKRTNNVECTKTDKVLGQLDQSIDSMFKTFKHYGTKKNSSKKCKKHVTAIHGYIYQLKLLMLFLYRGVSNRYSFSLGTEIAEAKKFDDLVFEYVQHNKKVYRLLQAKHKQDESKKITAHNLLSEKNGDYNLVKYFLSYQKSKKEQLFQGGSIKDVTICTNINWDYEDLEKAGITLVQIETKDDIFDVKSIEKQPLRYKFDDNVVLLLKLKLMECIAVKSTKESAKYTDDEIKDFLDHLVFAVNQPNEEELGQIVENEMGKEFGLISTENVYNKVFVKLLKWLMDKKEDRFLSYERGREFFKEARTGIPVWFNVKYPTSVFVGRIKELNTLHKMLQHPDKNAARIVSVCGLGGVGKSELVKQYINQYSQQYDNKVVWINAETYKTLVECFYRLARDKLRISTTSMDNKQKEIRSIIEDVYKFFADGKCLFIFDNVEKYKSEKELDHGIDSFLPSLPSNYIRPFVIITSRNKKWPENVQILHLGVFNEADATELITTSLCIQNNVQGNDIKQFVRELHYLPLALQQGVAYIKAEDQKLQNLGLTFKVHDYLKRYKEKIEVLDFRLPESTDSDYAKTIFTTWNVTLDMINEKEDGDNALTILCVASYLAPEDIPTEMFLGIVDDKDKLASAVELLKQYSMVNLDHAVLNVHRLVQQVIRVKLKMQNLEEDVLLKALWLFFKHTVNSDNVKHAISLCAYTKEYSRLLTGSLFLSCAIATEMYDSARFEEANLFCKQILQLLDTIPQDHPIIKNARLATKNNMGLICMEQGKYDMALKVFQEILDNQKLLGMEDSAECMIVKSNLGIALYYQGEYNEALKYYQQVYDGYTNLKDCGPEFNIIKTDIATILLKQGKFDNGLAILQEVCEAEERISGADNPLVIKTKGRIAVALMQQGKLGESLKMLTEVLAIEKDMRRKGRGIVSSTKFNIAQNLYLQGKYNKASKMLDEILKVDEKVLGKDHPEVLFARCQLVNILEQQGKLEEAKNMCEVILNKQKRILPPNHPDILHTLSSKANILASQQEFDSALKIYEEVLTEWRSNHDSEHPEILKLLSVIGMIHEKQGNYDKALKLCREVLRMQTQKLGTNNTDTLTTMNNIGLILHNKGQFSNALDIFNKVFEQSKALNDYNIQDVKSNIALALTGLGRYDMALKLFMEVLDVYKQNLMKGHHRITNTKNNIAALLLGQGRYLEALDFFHDVFKGFNKTFGPQSRDTVNLLDTIQNVLLTMITKNNVTELQRFLGKDKTLTVNNFDTKLLLRVAIDIGTADILNVLIKSGIDITSVNWNTLLHDLTLKDRVHMMEVLLQHVNPGKLSDFVNVKAGIAGETPLHIAVRCNNWPIVKLLLKHGAFYDIQTSNGGTPLNISVHPGISKLLLLINKLFQAARNGNEELINIVEKLKRDDLEVIRGVRNSLNHTLVQILKQNNRKKLLKSYLELVLIPS